MENSVLAVNSAFSTAFWQGFYDALTFWGVACAAVAGLVAGVLKGFTLTRAHVRLEPSTMVLLAISLLLSFDAAVTIAGSPTPGSLGRHAGGALLAIVCGTFCWPGLWWFERPRHRRVAAPVYRPQPGRKGAAP